MTLRAVLADDQASVRSELRTLLELDGRVEIVGEAADGLQLLDLLRRVTCDALLLDLTMPGKGGLEVLDDLARRGQRLPVVILSVHDDAAHVDRALSLGASGYVLKSARLDEIVGAIEAAVSGGAYVQPSLARPMLERHLILAGAKADARLGLSPRQLELLRALAIGLTNKEAAHLLGIGEETVKGYLKELYARLGVTTRSAAVAWGLRRGLIS